MGQTKNDSLVGGTLSLQLRLKNDTLSNSVPPRVLQKDRTYVAISTHMKVKLTKEIFQLGVPYLIGPVVDVVSFSKSVLIF